MIKDDIQNYKSVKKTTDPATNGGVMSDTVVQSGKVGNVFSHTFDEDRTNGKVETVKIFTVLKNSDDLPLVGAFPALWGPPDGGEEYAIIIPTTQRSVEADLIGTERFFTAGTLVEDVAAGDVLVKIDVRGIEVLLGMQAADRFFITDKATPDAQTGTEDDRVIDSVTTSGTVRHIVLTEGLTNGYTAGSAVGFTVPPSTDIETSYESLAVTAAGDYDYDDVNYPFTISNIGGIEEDFELEWTGATTFKVTRMTIAPGLISTGDINTDFIYLHPVWLTNMLTIKEAGHTGTPQAGDKFTLTTHPAALPVFERKFTPIGAAPVANSKLILLTRGQVANP